VVAAPPSSSCGGGSATELRLPHQSRERNGRGVPAGVVIVSNGDRLILYSSSDEDRYRVSHRRAIGWSSTRTGKRIRAQGGGRHDVRTWSANSKHSGRGLRSTIFATCWLAGQQLSLSSRSRAAIPCAARCTMCQRHDRRSSGCRSSVPQFSAEGRSVNALVRQ
jgi:hypothetical protein